MEMLWGRLQVASSRPCGTFRFSHFYPGLRPGLSSAVPAAIILQLVLTRTLKSPKCTVPRLLEPKADRPEEHDQQVNNDAKERKEDIVAHLTGSGEIAA